MTRCDCKVCRGESPDAPLAVNGADMSKCAGGCNVAMTFRDNHAGMTVGWVPGPGLAPTKFAHLACVAG